MKRSFALLSVLLTILGVSVAHAAQFPNRARQVLSHVANGDRCPCGLQIEYEERGTSPKGTLIIIRNGPVTVWTDEFREGCYSKKELSCWKRKIFERSITTPQLRILLKHFVASDIGTASPKNEKSNNYAAMVRIRLGKKVIGQTSWNARDIALKKDVRRIRNEIRVIAGLI